MDPVPLYIRMKKFKNIIFQDDLTLNQTKRVKQYEISEKQ